MKILKSLFIFVGGIGFILNLASCADWGKTDPDAGNQIYASRQDVANYNFEYSAKKPQFSDLNIINNFAEVIKDDSLGSNVLRLDTAGCARIANLFASVKLQNGAAITFWVKVDSTDLKRPLISFGSEDMNEARFTFGVNGQLSYSKPGQLKSLDLDENNPSVYETGIISVGKWHFVALQLSLHGYQLYVDGKKSLSGSESTATAATNFKYETLINFINNAPYIYIGTEKIGDKHNGVCYDDIALIGNQMDTKDWNKSANGNSGNKAFEYVVGNPITEVGTDDCKTAWWTSFSNYYRIPSNGIMHLRFVNHTSGAGNWNNWNLALTTDDDRGGGNYSEYFVIRSDKYGWGGSYVGDNFDNDGYPANDTEWAEFRKNMEGAVVDATISRLGSTINVKAVATCKNGKVYTEKFHATCGDGNQVVRAFFIVDNSYLVFDTSGCSVQTPVVFKSTTIGAEDNTSAWWTQFSDYFKISAGNTLHLGFTNHTSGAGSWNNWNLALTTDDERGGSNYSEYFVIRSDKYGWGGSYVGDNFENNGYPTNDTEWADFKKNMEGAKVDMTINRSGSTVNVNAVATCLSGKLYTEKFHAICGDGTQSLRAFLIVDSSHLVMDESQCYTESPLYK